jgi:Transglutaminase-like superfamily
MAKAYRGRRRTQSGRPWILGCFILVVAVVSIRALTLTQRDGRSSDKPVSKARSFSANTELGQFRPQTEAERELDSMLGLREEDIDLAMVNWLVAVDVPQFHDVTRGAYFAQLDAMTEQVRQDMESMQKRGWHGKDSDNPESRCIRFCSAIIRLRLTYAEQFRDENLSLAQMGAMYSDANNIFLAGLLRTRRGSCVSMPLIYLVIGQQLGLPVHLVSVGKHYFIRWEEPGYRLNIETTSTEKIAVTPDDSVYLEAEGMTRDRVSGSDLKNLTNHEVLGQLFFARSAYWVTKGPAFANERQIDLSRARLLAPDDPAIKATYQGVFNHSGNKLVNASLNITQKK